MFDLQLPRHISTLPLTTGRILAADCRFRGATDMSGPAACPALFAVDTVITVNGIF
jgi:hypothetical protein